RARSEEGLQRDPRRDPAVVRAFFVHPDFARRGIGRRLLELSEAAAQVGGFRNVEIIATLPGERLYSKFNYTTLDRFSRGLTRGEDDEDPDGIWRSLNRIVEDAHL
ncbi:MAG TPA: GNAT family N-acetyltransferase, partial [Opitutaceae bacterium]|nr:GNAT family N-acetyltransferase [Opitutaceae bacterium]